ncbi:1-aminocyclopropane-1-carboxylate oxidase 1-like [Pyrus ussuriensis x Pyrus communis]|uniref:1-aminocyclopropane-1-carboxylate oxidase 1-like n=1 Tax=Pyrus ussuriensis x Pyrus communis TaxID=2448454 RepID=A0A5N5H199_9ROSA|nr:1-aminocyclopropane-1-carboxylate oxidase 1-like [Pyrus ussuriensis x Pyrus communis]
MVATISAVGDELGIRSTAMGDNYGDRRSELKAFDDTKAGVKGLLDAGFTKIPRIFYCPSRHDHETEAAGEKAMLSIPVIDLQGIHQNDPASRPRVIDEVRVASEKWGFFQVVNHGIPVEVLNRMIDGVREFHELDIELKKEFYSRDFARKVFFMSNRDMYHSLEANWKDTLVCYVAPDPPKPEELPSVCGEIVNDYSKQVMDLGFILFELLSEALGLNSNHLKNMDCAEGLIQLCHYYPACPEPDLTLGTGKHTDGTFITILLQDQTGGLQVLYDNRWVNVPPKEGALIVNIGDFLQLMANDKYMSVPHRVISKSVGPRISVASFFRPYVVAGKSKAYAPIKELVTEENPQFYREVELKEYMMHHASEKAKGTCQPLLHFKI